MFPTTLWTRLGAAGDHDAAALEDFAAAYRPAVLSFIERRGYRGSRADDLCQEVFLRVLRGGVLAKADPRRGRFRSLLLRITVNAMADETRRRRETTVPDLDPADTAADAALERDPDFDHAWALHLTERALGQLRDEPSPYYGVLRGHLAGEQQKRNRLWHARRRLAALVRREVAYTCRSPADAEDEVRYLARFLGSPARDDDSPQIDDLA